MASISVNPFTIEGYWDWIILYRTGKMVPASQLGSFVEQSAEVASGFLGQVPRALSAH